jgi:transposase
VTQEKRVEPEFAALVAIDWADQKHFWKLQDGETGKVERGQLDNQPEAVAAWANELSQRYGGRAVAVCVEQSRGALVYMLNQYPQLVLYPVHPKTSARYREAFHPSGAKSDPADTDLLLDLLQHHRDRLRCLRPDTVEMRLVQGLAEERRKMVNEKTRHSHRLTACLKTYFPQILTWFDDVDSPLVCGLLERWGTLQQLQRAHPGTLRKFFHEHNCRSEERIQERIDAIYPAQPATQDAAVLEVGAVTAGDQVAILKTLHTQIAALDHRIAELFSEQPDSAIFASLPGAGPALAPRLMVAFGSDRARYADASQVQNYSGIAPVKESSGQGQWVHFRRACPKFLRQTFHEFAGHSITRSEWATAFYQLQRDKGKGHHAAVRALAFKWIRIIYACWKNRTPYDEKTYLAVLAKRNSPLGATGLECKTVAGFKKLS